MSEDFGAAIVDAAAAESTPVTTDSAAVETPSTETTTNVSDFQVETADNTTSETADSTEGKETETTNADGTEKTPEQVEQFKADAKADGKESASILDQRAALKALRDLDPKYASVVKSLHSSAERWNAAKELLGTGENSGIVGLKNWLQEANVKTLPELRQAFTQQSAVLDTVKATDELLYSADPKLWDNVYEDLKANGNEDQYSKNAENMLQHLKSVDSAGYYEVTKGHVVSGLAEAGLPEAINSIWAALSSGDVEKAKGLVKSTAQWFTGLRDEVSEKGKLEKALSEREAKLVSKEETAQKAERQKFETGVAEDCEKYNNTALGKVLGGFLKMPFFKEFPYETKVIVGNQIKNNLYTALKADKAYQTQMSAMWKQKTPDRARMIQYHQSKLDAIATDIVTKTVQTMYPSYAKGGSAAGKAAAATAGKANATKAANASVATGKPIYVASRPENIIREPIRVAGKEYSANDLQVLQISGKGFVKTTDGKSVKFVTWRR
jgi:hypothetical protein